MPTGENLATCFECGKRWVVGDCIPSICPACECKEHGHLMVMVQGIGICCRCGERVEGNTMAKPRKPRTVRTLAQLRSAFMDGTINRKLWVLCLDSGGCFLRYVGPNREGMEPAKPVALELASSPYALLEEACELAGVPAEQA